MSRWLVVPFAALALVATGARAEKEIEVVIHEDGWHRGPVPLDSLLRSALASDTVWSVRRFQGPAGPATRVTPSLVPRLRAILLRADSEGDGYDLPKVCESCPDQLPILISLGTQGADTNLLDLDVWFREAQGRYVAHNGWVGRITFSKDAPELLALIKRTLPADSVVQRYEWHPRPDSLPREGAPRDEANPKFGEYVDVEVLPEPLVKVPPEYPAEARDLGVDGLVVVQALIDRSGQVADTRVTKSIRPLDDAAVAAVRQWKFKPATTKGKPVAVWIAIPVKFSLH